jgi:mitochondrial fission protein ELM1
VSDRQIRDARMLALRVRRGRIERDTIATTLEALAERVEHSERLIHDAIACRAAGFSDEGWRYLTAFSRRSGDAA